jgi:glycosyltransferase involved in cell wall biosynthesis
MFDRSLRVAFFIGFFGGGGIERVMANLAHGFVKQGVKVDLLHDRESSPHLWRMPAETRFIDYVNASSLYKNLPRVIRYLKEEKPTALMTADHYANEVAIVARRIAGGSTRLIVTEHNQLSRTAQNATQLKARLAPFAAHFLYPWADEIVAVSQGVATDLAQTASLPPNRIQTIYNPVITPEMLAKAQEPVDHPWFNSSEVPVLLGVGKLEAQKDFPNLIQAFAKVRQLRPARLAILGWGPDRSQLEALIQELGLQDDVELLGYTQNPYAYMSRSSVFVLSSAWEGLPTVLIEAMALGIPVVSTDCKSGPSEILAEGQYGHLTPVGNSDALAEAILQVLAGQPRAVDTAWLDQFGLEAATNRYLQVLGIQPSVTTPSQRIVR